MIDARLRLYVFTSPDDAAFTDQSNAALDYSRDPFTVSLATAGYMYIGYRKPFGAVYAELTTPNANANELAFEYWNGTAWTALTAYDRTNGLKRSAYMSWEAPSEWALTTVNGAEAFWVRAQPSVAHSATVFSGLNLVYADDYDLQTEFPAVQDSAFLPAGEVSHIKTHVAVRNQLTQDLRNKGRIKTDANGNWQNLTPWDLHDIEEVRQAATFLALAKIFFNYSDNPGDHWTAKSKFYDGKYKAMLDLVKISYDADDDGVVDSNERQTIRVTRMSR